MKCPRCHDVELVEGGPLSSSSCARCGGGLMLETGLVTLLEELKHSLEELKELAKLYGGERLPCPQCKTKMSPLTLHGEQVDLCFGCGSLWLDKGELEAITHGRHTMPPPTAPSTKDNPKALAAVAPAQALVRVDERSVGRHLLRATLAGVGAVGIIWSVVGIVPGTSMLLGAAALGAAAGLSRRRAFDVLPRARRMMRWKGWFAPDAKAGEGVAFSPDSCVVVREVRAAQRRLPLVVIELVDGEGRFLARLRGPMLAVRAWTEAPRYARALGVSVRFDVDSAADDALDLEDARRPDLPAFAALDVVRIEPDPAAGKLRRFHVRGATGTPVGSVTTELALKGKPRNLDELLAEHFVIDGGAGEAVRLFSTTLLEERTTVLVGKEGRVLGHVAVKRGLLGDDFVFHGPQGRRSAQARMRHGSSEARIVDGHGRGAGVLDLAQASPSDPRAATLHLFPGRLTGDARWGLLALALHASLANVVTDL